MQTLRVSRAAAAVGTVLVLIFVAGLTLAAQQPTGSQPSLKGVWRVTEWTSTGPGPGGPPHTNKSPQPWYVVLTDKHYTFVGVNGDTPRPEWPTAADKVTEKDRSDAAVRFIGQMGAYDVTASGEFTVKALVTLNPNTMTTVVPFIFTYRLDGANIFLLTQKGPPNAPVPTPISWKLVRVE